MFTKGWDMPHHIRTWLRIGGYRSYGVIKILVQIVMNMYGETQERDTAVSVYIVKHGRHSGTVWGLHYSQ